MITSNPSIVVYVVFLIIPSSMGAQAVAEVLGVVTG